MTVYKIFCGKPSSIVFELFLVDVFREIFNQLRTNGTTKFSKLVAETKHQKTRGSKKGVFPIPYSRTKCKSKSVEHTLIKGYNWLLKLNLIPVGIEIMSQGQIKTYLKNLNRLYITNSNDLFALFFQ